MYRRRLLSGNIFGAERILLHIADLGNSSNTLVGTNGLALARPSTYTLETDLI